MQNEELRELDLLVQIEQDPDISQAKLASELGVAVGTINWHIKRLIDKGCVKVKRAQKKKLRYIITPEGIALRARLTVDYIRSSFKLYRLIRERSLMVLKQLESQGYNKVRIKGEGEIAEVCRLTCLDQGFVFSEESGVPWIKIDGMKLLVDLDGNNPSKNSLKFE